jgi:hypothetical protein
MLVVIMMLFKATATVGIVAFFIIPVTMMSRTFSLASMTLGVLPFVSKLLYRFVFPTIGKCNTSAAKDYNDKDAKDVRRFHYFPPNDLQRTGHTSKI